MQRITLEEDNAAFRARQAQNKTKKKRAKRNASRTVATSKTAKRRARASSKTGSRKATAKIRSVAKARKASTKRASGKTLKKSSRVGKRRNAYQWHGLPQRVRFISGEYKGKTGVVQSVIQKRYTKEPTVYRIQVDGFPKPGGWSGKVTAEPHQLEAIRENPKGKRRNPQVLAIINRTSPKARANRKEFAGEYRKDTPLRFPEGTPTSGISKLGKLLLIKTENATVRPTIGQTWLCRDAQGKLHLGTTNKDGVIWHGPAQSFGKVKRVEYEDVKKHLGYDKPQGFYHFMGEEDGIRPTLYADGKGGLKFKGGNYRITPEGIVN